MADDDPLDRVPTGPKPLPIAERDFYRPEADRRREIQEIDPKLQQLLREIDRLQERRNRLEQEADAQSDIANPRPNALPPLMRGLLKKQAIESRVIDQMGNKIKPSTIEARNLAYDKQKTYKEARGEIPTLDQYRMDTLWKRAEDLTSDLTRTTRNIERGVTDAAIGEQVEFETLDNANRLEYEVRRRRINNTLGQPLSQTTIQYGNRDEFQVGDKVLFKNYKEERRLDGDNIERVVRTPYPDVYEGRILSVKQDELNRPYQTKVTVKDLNSNDTYSTAFGYMVKAPRMTDQLAGLYDLPRSINQERSPFSFRAPSEPGATLNEAQLNFPTQGDEFRKEKFFLNYLASDMYPDKARQLPINLFRSIGDFLGQPASKMIQDKQDLKQTIVNRNRAIEQIRQLPLVIPDVKLTGSKRDREEEGGEVQSKKSRVGSMDSDTTVPYGEELDREDKDELPPLE